MPITLNACLIVALAGAACVTRTAHKITRGFDSWEHFTFPSFSSKWPRVFIARSMFPAIANERPSLLKCIFCGRWTVAVYAEGLLKAPHVSGGTAQSPPSPPRQKFAGT